MQFFPVSAGQGKASGAMASKLGTTVGSLFAKLARRGKAEVARGLWAEMAQLREKGAIEEDLWQRLTDWKKSGDDGRLAAWIAQVCPGLLPHEARAFWEVAGDDSNPDLRLPLSSTGQRGHEGRVSIQTERGVAVPPEGQRQARVAERRLPSQQAGMASPLSEGEKKTTAAGHGRGQEGEPPSVIRGLVGLGGKGGQRLADGQARDLGVHADSSKSSGQEVGAAGGLLGSQPQGLGQSGRPMGAAVGATGLRPEAGRKDGHEGLATDVVGRRAPESGRATTATPVAAGVSLWQEVERLAAQEGRRRSASQEGGQGHRQRGEGESLPWFNVQEVAPQMVGRGGRGRGGEGGDGQEEARGREARLRRMSEARGGREGFEAGAMLSGEFPVVASSRPEAVASSIVEQTAQALVRQLSPGLKQLAIQIEPQELGPIHVTLQVRGGEVQAVLRPTNPETGQILAAHLPTLRQELERQGFQVARLDVQAGLPDAGSHGAWDGAGHQGQWAQPESGGPLWRRLVADEASVLARNLQVEDQTPVRSASLAAGAVDLFA